MKSRRGERRGRKEHTKEKRKDVGERDGEEGTSITHTNPERERDRQTDICESEWLMLFSLLVTNPGEERMGAPASVLGASLFSF